MRSALVLLSLSLFLCGFIQAPHGGACKQFKGDTTTPSRMKQYWLVLLHRGNNRTQDSIGAAKIQAAHMRNINKLAESGALIMAGPIGKEGSLRGIFIIDAPDPASVYRMVQQDSAVLTGRLRMEIFPWWAQKGTYQFN